MLLPKNLLRMLIEWIRTGDWQFLRENAPAAAGCASPDAAHNEGRFVVVLAIRGMIHSGAEGRIDQAATRADRTGLARHLPLKWYGHVLRDAGHQA